MPISVYIVDDEEESRNRIRYVINNFFNGELIIIGETDDPQDAIQDVVELKPDILFLDIVLPGVTGFTVSSTIKKRGFRGKIIFCTMFNQYSIKALRAAAFDFLTKPVDVDELKQAIERYKENLTEQFDIDLIKQFELSDREVEILIHLSKGMSSEKIAKEMFLSKYTVDTHRRNIMAKTKTKNTIELLNLLRV